MLFIKFYSPFLLCFYFLLTNCTSENNPKISKSDFITVYANLSVINELSISKDYHDKLVEELLQKFNIQVSDIQKSVEFYHQDPQQWLQILEQVKEKIAEMRKIERKSQIP